MALSRTWLLTLTTLALLLSLLPLLLWRQRQLQARVGPQGLAVGDRLTFVDSTYAAGSRHHWRWEFGPPAAVSTQRDGRFSYGTPGTYQVRLTVDSTLHREFKVWVKARRPLADTAVVLLAPAAGYLGEQLLFRVQGDSLGEVVWDFGDNSPRSHAPVAVHTYLQAGRYRVTLRTSTDPHEKAQLVAIRALGPVPGRAQAVQAASAAIRWRLQRIASGAQVNGHYRYLLAQYVRRPDLPVLVDKQPPRDFYSYCMGLQFDRGWLIDHVALQTDSLTGQLVGLRVAQHKPAP